MAIRKRKRTVTDPTGTTDLVMNTSTATTDGDSTTTTTTTRSTTIGGDLHNIWPLWYLLGGLAVGFGWLWGNTLQIQTSEAWILQLKSGIALAPHFAILGQITDFFGGTLTQSQVIADTWGWGNQFIILICSIGIEFPAHTPKAQRRAAWFGWGCLLFIILNSLADFSYSALGGFWQQLAFAGICLMMSFFFGLLSLHLMITGLSRMRS